MESIAVTKPNMAVLDQDGVGLSAFGVRSALFGAEVLQRSRRQLGAWGPVPLDLLEEEPEASAPVNVNLDLTLELKNLREERKKTREEKKEQKRQIQALEKRVERVVLREQTLRVQEETQQITIQAGEIGRSHTIQVTRPSAPHRGLEPVSGLTASPSTGGWLPEWGQERPGFPDGKPKAAAAGGSILLPDALRRRRALAAAFFTAVDRAEELVRRDSFREGLDREELKREISRAVEEALVRQNVIPVRLEPARRDQDRKEDARKAEKQTVPQGKLLKNQDILALRGIEKGQLARWEEPPR